MLSGSVHKAGEEDSLNSMYRARQKYLPTVAWHKLQRLDDTRGVFSIEVAVPPALVPLHSSQRRGSAGSVLLPPGISCSHIRTMIVPGPGHGDSCQRDKSKTGSLREGRAQRYAADTGRPHSMKSRPACRSTIHRPAPGCLSVGMQVSAQGLKCR